MTQVSNSLTPDLLVFKCPTCGRRLLARMAAYLVQWALEHPSPPTEVLLTAKCSCKRIVHVCRRDVHRAA